jgi:hypothetical protein
MQCTGGTRSTVRTVARTAALVVAGAALVGSVATASELRASDADSTMPRAVSPAAPATLLVALPDRIGTSNRAW